MKRLQSSKRRQKNGWCVKKGMVGSRERRQRLAECWSLCEIPVVAVTNYQKLGGLKEHRVTGRSEVWNGVHWAEAKCWQGCTPSRGSRGECYPAFEASRIHVYSLAHSPSSIFQASSVSIFSPLWPLTHCFHHYISLSHSDPPTSLL